MLEPIVLKFGTSDYVGDMIAPVRAFRQMSEISFFSLLLFCDLTFFSRSETKPENRFFRYFTDRISISSYCIPREMILLYFT